MSQQLPLDHVHLRHRVLASRVVTLWIRLGTCDSTTRAVDRAYETALGFSEDELTEMRVSLESEAAAKTRAASYMRKVGDSDA